MKNDKYKSPERIKFMTHHSLVGEILRDYICFAGFHRVHNEYRYDHERDIFVFTISKDEFGRGDSIGAYKLAKGVLDALKRIDPSIKCEIIHDEADYQ